MKYVQLVKRSFKHARIMISLDLDQKEAQDNVIKKTIVIIDNSVTFANVFYDGVLQANSNEKGINLNQVDRFSLRGLLFCGNASRS